MIREQGSLLQNAARPHGGLIHWERGLLRTGIDASGVAGFLYDDFGKLGEAGLQPFPYPLRKDFAGGVFEAFDIIEAMMVELVKQGLKGPPQIGEVHYPARFLAHGTADVDFDPEGVSVHAGTFVPLRDIGQPVGRLDLKNPKNIHERIVPPMV